MNELKLVNRLPGIASSPLHAPLIDRITILYCYFPPSPFFATNFFDHHLLFSSSICGNKKVDYLTRLLVHDCIFRCVQPFEILARILDAGLVTDECTRIPRRMHKRIGSSAGSTFFMLLFCLLITSSTFARNIVSCHRTKLQRLADREIYNKPHQHVEFTRRQRYEIRKSNMIATPSRYDVQVCRIQRAKQLLDKRKRHF